MSMSFDEQKELYKKGSAALEFGKLDEAEEYFTQIIAEDPEHLDTLNKLGVVYIYRQDKEKAKEYFQKCLASKDNHVPSLSNMASLELEAGNVNQAEVMFRRVLALDPNYGPAHNNMAVILKKSGRYGEAVKHMKKAQKAGTFSVKRTEGKGGMNRGCLIVVIMGVIALILYLITLWKG